MLLDNKAVFIKYRQYLDIETLIQVVVPRKFRLVVKSRNALFETEAACLRYSIRVLKQEGARIQQSLNEAQLRVNQNNYQVTVLKEQLKRAKV